MSTCKVFYTLALAAVWSIGAAADTVSLSVYARPTHEVLAEVSKQTGLKVEASHGIRDVPLFIEVKDMPAKAFLERLVKITDAEWQRHDDRLVLTREANRLRAALAVETQDRAPRVAEAIRKYLEQNRGQEEWTDAKIEEQVKRDLQTREQMRRQLGERGGFVQTISTSAQTPASSVLFEALRRIPVEALAGIQPGKRLVLSSSPNSLQKPLGYNAAPSIERFMTVQRRVAAALEAAGGSDRRISTDLSSGEIKPVVELIISIQRMTEGEALNFTAYLVAADGSVVAQPRAFISPAPVGAGTAPSGTDHAITLPPESAALLQILKGASPQGSRVAGTFSIALAGTDGNSIMMGGGPGRLPVPEGLAEKMREPTKYDPLSFVAGDLLRGLAQKTGKSVMATLPDSFLGHLSAVGNTSEVNLKALWTHAPLGLQITSNEHGWLIQPRLFAEADRQRVNRAELERLVQSNNRLDDIVRYAPVMSIFGQSSLDTQWTRAMAHTAYRQLSDSIKRPYLRLYGLLPANSRRPARGGGTEMFVNQLAPAARVVAEEILLRSGGIMIMGEGAMAISMDMSTGPQRPATPQIMIYEATEVFPNGIDGSVRLRISTQGEEMLYAIDANDLGEFLTAADLGFRMGVPSGTPGFMSPSFKEYQLADADRIRMQFFVGQTPRGETTLDDQRIRTPISKVTLDTLPPGMKERFDRARKQASEMKFGDFRGGPPANRPPSP